ncbi:MAG: maleylpyruvate isomerase N-terminal domain-containing protein [Actinomycetota bacterium]
MIEWTEPRVSRIRDEHLPLPTPCTEWDVRALLEHMVSGNPLGAAARGRRVDRAGGGPLRRRPPRRGPRRGVARVRVRGVRRVRGSGCARADREPVLR